MCTLDMSQGTYWVWPIMVVTEKPYVNLFPVFNVINMKFTHDSVQHKYGYNGYLKI